MTAFSAHEFQKHLTNPSATPTADWHVLVQHLALCMFPSNKCLFFWGNNFHLHIFGGFWGSFMQTLYPSYDLPFLPIELFLGVCVCLLHCLLCCWVCEHINHILYKSEKILHGLCVCVNVWLYKMMEWII